MCAAMARQGADVELLALREGRGHTEKFAGPFRLTLVETAGNRYLPCGWPRRFKEAMRKSIGSSPGSRLVHDNGVWLPTNHFSGRLARQAGVPFVVSPRGMLEPWALESGRVHKKAAWWLYQKRDLQQASLLHATSVLEAGQLRRLQLKAPIAVIPNGVEIPAEDFRVAGSNVWRGNERIVLFLSRVHPKKGLLDLVRAWAKLRPVGWKVVIAGPDESGHQSEVETLAAQSGVREAFDFVGPIGDDQKWSLYRKADLFVLPSHSENFGLVIAEALGCGLPVITTRSTPWEDIAAHQCGWWIETGADALAEALREALAGSGEARREMGRRGRDLVAEKFCWSNVATQMLSCYEWLLHKAARPGCIYD